MSGLSIAHDAWVVVGDGEKALFFRNEGDEAYPNLEVINVLESDLQTEDDAQNHRHGRYEDGEGHKRQHNALDWYRLEKHRFAKEIADILYSAAHRGRYSKLVIAAPPMTMGDIRRALHKEVADKVVAEVSKDLTNMPPHEIERVLLNRH